MKGEVRLGRVAGVPLSVHWSVVIVLGLLVLSLSEGILPATVDDASTPALWLAGAAGGLLFLLSLLAHELAHALVARRHGVGVRGMTLWLFGGVAELEREAPTPRAELRIAGAGPLTSGGCAAGFGAAAVVLAALGLPLAAAVLAWLAAANAVLAMFNLIPGAPLDGGRILRAWLWRRHGDRLRATLTAATAGRVVGYGLVALGIVEFVIGADAGGLWTVLIGWFLLNAARAEAARAVASDALGGLRVRDVMTADPQRVPAWASLQAFVHEFALASRHSSFPVEDLDGRTVGLVTLAQVKACPAETWPELTVGGVMTPIAHARTAAPGDDLATALAGGSATGGRVLVFDDGALVGIVTPSDVTSALERNLLRSRSAQGRSGAAANGGLVPTPPATAPS
jgi:Zn-dependent protease